MGTAQTGYIISGITGAAVILACNIFLSGDDSGSSVSGINNLGNTCFLNSLLQALSSCKTFLDYLAKLSVRLHSRNPNDVIVRELKSFLRFLKEGKETLSPNALVNSLSEKFPHFGLQHDSHEIFYVIQESISEVNKKPLRSLRMNELDATQKEENPKNPFHGLMSTEVACSVCKHKTFTLESMFDISVTVTASLEESLQALSKKEIIDDFQCQRCSIAASLEILKNKRNFPSEIFGKKEEALKKSYERRLSVDDAELVIKQKQRASLCHKIARFPKLLCIHCKWLVQSPLGYIQKISGQMRFDLNLEFDWLMQEKLCLNPSQITVKYELKAVIEHLGGSLGGHYLTYRENSGVWYLCSDVDVREVKEDEVLRAQPYMLFYERVK